MGYASWGSRVGASIIDGLIVLPIWIVAELLGGFSVDGAASSGPGAMYFIVALTGLGVNIYNRWIQQGRTGQTWGKKILGIRLVGDASGHPIGVGKTFVRDIAHIVDTAICYIGWLFPLWDGKNQTIGDKIMSTVVVVG